MNKYCTKCGYYPFTGECPSCGHKEESSPAAELQGGGYEQSYPGYDAVYSGYAPVRKKSMAPYIILSVFLTLLISALLFLLFGQMWLGRVVQIPPGYTDPYENAPYEGSPSVPESPFFPEMPNMPWQSPNTATPQKSATALTFTLDDYSAITPATSANAGIVIPEGRVYLVLQLTLENFTEEPLVPDFDRLKLGMDNDETFLPPLVGSGVLKPSIPREPVAPGESVSGFVVFDVPAGVKLFSIFYYTEMDYQGFRFIIE